MKLQMRLNHHRSCPIVNEDPIVAFEVTHYLSLTGAPLATLLTGELGLARSLSYDVGSGRCTSKDWNFRPIRQSEVEKRRAG